MEARPTSAGIATTAAIPAAVDGRFVELDGETYYRISGFHRLPPFLMTLPGDTDLWMFVASGGGLTAGRVDPDGSLFPYRTVDQLHEAHHHTGPITLIRVRGEDGDSEIWAPFAEFEIAPPQVERNLYKNATGNRLVFEEIHHGHGLRFRYRWAASDEFGWVRTATIQNRGQQAVRVTLLDGLRNVLPYGAPLSLYQRSSNLVDAYKRTEVDPGTGLGIFSLTSRITDRAEALEVLRANVVWSCGLPNASVHLPPDTVPAFRDAQPLPQDEVLRGGRGNYLVSASLELEPGAATRWHMVGDVALDHVQITALRHRLHTETDLADRIESNLRDARENLRRNVGSADGLQLTNHDEGWVHHFANVLYNNMRGGVFLQNHEVPTDDLQVFLRIRNRAVADRYSARLEGLPDMATMAEILEMAEATGDADFRRLCYEYLPLYFARRHGDPSRPWNRFSIRARNRHGFRELNYQGNWRDIFQNWEALGTAFPGFLANMVAKFVNASTVDGFNPYRVTREGVEWEIVEPEDPWSNIGYWGDHQVIYLLKLLEALDAHDPHGLGALLDQEIFSYVDVPYRIKPYADLLRDTRDTIEFDDDLEARIEARVASEGTDGRLLRAADGSVHHANLLEKLLVPALSKLSNLVPDAGIWMNTQRPEWNDANNALAGGGVSVVTLCYLRRYLAFLADRLGEMEDRTLPVAQEVLDWFGRIESAFLAQTELLEGSTIRPDERKSMMDALGVPFSEYRAKVYRNGFSGRGDLAVSRVVELSRLALRFLDWGIAANRRDDGLYHTYNVLDIDVESDRVEVVHLQEMLEGQVAALSSGFLSPDQSVGLLESMYRSRLYRASERSFLLYPERELEGFLARNVVPASRVEAIPLLGDLLADGQGTVVQRDADGVVRFQGDLRNAEDLEEALDGLARTAGWEDRAQRDREAVLDLFEEVFQHHSYTGRSGVMFAYEGLGCIYWHMVAKLLLAVQEQYQRAVRTDEPAPVRQALAKMYFRVRAGINYEKTVEEFGAFPTDPYSHTPPQGGAKQPGMTGQVKEEILTRRGELGIEVEGGTIRFQPRLLRSGEFLRRAEKFDYYDVGGRAGSLALPPDSLAFTLCQVPVVYENTAGPSWIRLTHADGTSTELQGNVLDEESSRHVLARDGRIAEIHVGVKIQD